MNAATGERADVATQFDAMACPCVVLVDTADVLLGRHLGAIAQAEARRIEAKYTRYGPSVVTDINRGAGADFIVDDETAELIDYAQQCFRLSDGRFDITSGVLRRVWRFGPGARVPAAGDVERVLADVGWQRVEWQRPRLRLQAGMEIDFGGIGKEYAVDRALALVRRESPAPVLVNFGGDLAISGLRGDGRPWRVGIEDVDRSGASAGIIGLSSGAIATSGDAVRCIVQDGIRYGHVLDPTTGWPVKDAPRSVTVHAATCSEAGLLAKLALLRGAGAEEFLRAESVRAWCMR